MTTALFDFLNELQKQVTGDLRTDEVSRVLYSTDASIYQVMPHGVLIPKTIDDVQAAVECAHRYHVPIVARTGGSSLAGQAVNEALIIDFSRHLDAVLEVNLEEQWVRVQPGIVLDELNNQLGKFGLQFGPDPASSNRAALGGIVSNNSTGAHSILYGMTADHVLETNVILNDGSTTNFSPLTEAQLAQKQALSGREGLLYQQTAQLTRNADNQGIIRRDTPRHWRRCGGYNLDRLMPPEGLSFQWPVDERFNLAKLVCGSEGTLAVMTEIKLNLVPKPTKTALAVVHFGALHTALTAVPTILETDPSLFQLEGLIILPFITTIPRHQPLKFIPYRQPLPTLRARAPPRRIIRITRCSASPTISSSRPTAFRCWSRSFASGNRSRCFRSRATSAVSSAVSSGSGCCVPSIPDATRFRRADSSRARSTASDARSPGGYRRPAAMSYCR